MLRDDGSCWVNLGSTYASSDMRPTQSLEHVPAYDSDGKESPDSPGAGRVCPRCGGGLQAGSLNRRGRIVGTGQQNEPETPQPLKTDRDSEHSACVSSVPRSPASAARRSTKTSSKRNARVASSRANKALACPSEQATSPPGAHQSGHNSAYTSGTEPLCAPSTRCTSDTELFCMACGYCTTKPQFKQSDLIPIPWLFAIAMQRAGWYLRSDVTWVKTSPMPESVSGWRWERCRVKTASRDISNPGAKTRMSNRVC